MEMYLVHVAPCWTFTELLRNTAVGRLSYARVARDSGNCICQSRRSLVRLDAKDLGVTKDPGKHIPNLSAGNIMPQMTMPSTRPSCLKRECSSFGIPSFQTHMALISRLLKHAHSPIRPVPVSEKADVFLERHLRRNKQTRSSFEPCTGRNGIKICHQRVLARFCPVNSKHPLTLSPIPPGFVPLTTKCTRSAIFNEQEVNRANKAHFGIIQPFPC